MTTVINEETRTILEKFHYEYYKDYFRNFCGLSRTTNYYEIFSKYDIFSTSDFTRSLNSLSSDNSTDNNLSRLLIYFLIKQSLLKPASPELDRINNMECSLIGNSTNRENISLRNLERIIPAETNREERRSFSDLGNRIRNDLDSLYITIMNIFNYGLESTGYKNFSQFYRACHSYSLVDLLKTAELFLYDTDYIYRDLLSWYIKRKMDMDIADLRDHDLEFFFNNFELKQNFPELKFNYVLEKSFREMDLQKFGNIEFNTARNINKVHFDCVFPLNPPSEVIVSIYPEPGIKYYLSLLEGFATAGIYISVNNKEPFEHRNILDPLFLNTFGALFRRLLLNSRWLAKLPFGIPEKDSLIFMYLGYLRDLRLMAANALYEQMILGGEENERLKEIYSESYYRATASRTDGSGHMAFIKNPFSTTEKLAGSLFATELNMYLVEKFDEQWWRVPECCQYLKGLWSGSYRYDISYLQKDIKLTPYDLNLLYDEFNRIF